jgi:hypothetical protein
MPKRHQQWPAKKAAGRNNPEKSTPITTGTPKKQETYKKEAAEGRNPEPVPQESKVPPTRDPSMGASHRAESQERLEDRERRSGSESDATRHRKGDRVHDHNKWKKQPESQEGGGFISELENDEFAHDLQVAHRPAEDLGLGEASPVGAEFSAYDIKEMHDKLADLTDDELKRVMILPVGTRLEQGGKYIDLQHLERGEFVAEANMAAGPDNYYVPKKGTDYVIWNRLNQVANPARMDNEF